MKQAHRPTTFTLVELLMVILILLILMGLFMGVLQKSRDKALRAPCAANLKYLGIALHMYTNDYDGFFPNVNDAVSGSPLVGNWQPLGSQKYIGDGNSKLWACPSVAVPLTTPDSSNYRYYGSGRRDDNVSASLLTVGYDASGNHPKNNWMNALFIDGHVDGAKPDGAMRVTYPIGPTSNAVSAWNLNSF
jgi:prepilin-type processing-associated H-X9-DG protein